MCSLKKMSNSSGHFVTHIAYFDAVNLFFIYLDISPLSDAWFANIFSHSWVAFLFDYCLCYAEAFSLTLSYLFIFAFVVFIFGVNSKRPLPRPMSRSLPSKFLLEVYGFRPYIHIFNAFWVNFCVKYKSFFSFIIIHSISFFYMWLSTFPNTIYWRDNSSPIAYSWALCYKFLDHICIGLLEGLSILLYLIYVFVYMTVAYCFDEYDEVWCLQLCSFFSSCFDYLRSLVVPHKSFRIVCSSLVKNVIAILIGNALNP